MTMWTSTSTAKIPFNRCSVSTARVMTHAIDTYPITLSRRACAGGPMNAVKRETTITAIIEPKTGRLKSAPRAAALASRGNSDATTAMSGTIRFRCSGSSAGM